MNYVEQLLSLWDNAKIPVDQKKESLKVVLYLADNSISSEDLKESQEKIVYAFMNTALLLAERDREAVIQAADKALEESELPDVKWSTPATELAYLLFFLGNRVADKCQIEEADAYSISKVLRDRVVDVCLDVFFKGEAAA